LSFGTKVKYLLLTAFPIAFGVKAQYNNVLMLGMQKSFSYSQCQTQVVSNKRNVKDYALRVSSVCDKAGNLALFSCFDTIFDQNGNIVKGSPVLHSNYYLGNDICASKLIPKGKNSYWFIYQYDSTYKHLPSKGSGLYYSVIEHNSKAGWTITKSNIRLSNHWGISNLVVVIRDDYHFWIVQRISDSLLAFSVDSNSISSPVITKIGDSVNDSFRCNYGLGSSLDGKTFVLVAEIWKYNNQSGHSARLMTINFDPQSGSFNNSVSLDYEPVIAQGSAVFSPYLAFSPNDSFFYIGKFIQDSDRDYIRVIQYNRITKDSLCIYSSLLPSSNLNPIYSMTLAQDGKIYVCRYGNSFLDAIEFPDKSGPNCQYHSFAIRISENDTNRGLPFPDLNQSINTYFKLAIGSSIECNNVFLEAQHDPHFNQFRWSVDDSISLSGEKKIISNLGRGRYHRINLTASTPEGFTKCASKRFYLPETVKAGFKVSDTLACTRSAIQFFTISTYDSTNSNKFTGKWDFGDGQFDSGPATVHFYQKAGTYKVSFIASDRNCSDTAIHFVKVFEKPNVSLIIDDTAGYAPFHVQVNRQAYPAEIEVRYQFIDSAGFSASDSFTYKKPGAYWLKQQAVNKNGCSQLDSQKIVVKERFHFWLPNAFSPDNNGINDSFAVITSLKCDYRMEIYNRWGERIYYSENKPWNGTSKGLKCPSDVYRYYFIIHSPYGETFYRSGNVLLIN
jgi:gliding motility-associated-like protein